MHYFFKTQSLKKSTLNPDTYPGRYLRILIQTASDVSA